MRRAVATIDDVLEMLDGLFDDDADRWTERGAGWWDHFYDDRDREVPFFAAVPDESLAVWHHDGRLPVRGTGRALDLGCGAGRNAIWLAQQGYQVDALDLSATAVAWAAERADALNVEVNFVRTNAFAWRVPAGGYDLVYDSGCFHHLPPHRRLSYRMLLERAVAPGGSFGLACFASGAVGSDAPDSSFYRDGSLAGGVAYSEDDLRRIFSWLTLVDLRRMRDLPPGDTLFGQSFLWAGLFHRPG